MINLKRVKKNLENYPANIHGSSWGHTKMELDLFHINVYNSEKPHDFTLEVLKECG